jgi:DNA mismatch repair protein MSH5
MAGTRLNHANPLFPIRFYGLAHLLSHHSIHQHLTNRPITSIMAGKAPFKVPFYHKSSRRNASGSSDRGRRTLNSATSRRSVSTAAVGSSRAYVQTQRGTNDSSSTRVPSESEVRDGRPDDLPNDETLNEVVMAVDMTPRGTVGCCYYVAREEKLFFMEDIQFGNVDVVDTLRVFISPTVVLVSTKIYDTVIDSFDPEARSSGSMTADNDQFRLPFLLEVRPPSEFYYSAARSKLVSLQLGEDDGTRVSFNVPGELGVDNHREEDNVAGQQGQLLRLAGWVDIESRITVHLHLSSMT